MAEDEEALDDLIARIQRGEEPKPAPLGIDHVFVQKLDFVSDEMLRRADVTYSIRVEHGVFPDPPKYHWVKPGLISVSCDTILTDLDEKRREDAVLAACSTHDVGRTPCFILGYSWFDRQGAKWARTFKEPYTKA